MSNNKNIKNKNVGNKRNGKKWTINEILSLQRECQLLNMRIEDIAAKHHRNVDAIWYKMESEGFMVLRDVTDSGIQIYCNQ